MTKSDVLIDSLHFWVDGIRNEQHQEQATAAVAELGSLLGDQVVILTAFRHASNSIGLATNVASDHVDHDEAAKSVAGDHYFLELIAESELRYKRLKAAAEAVQEDLLFRAEKDSEGVRVVNLSSSAWNNFKEALK